MPGLHLASPVARANSVEYPRYETKKNLENDIKGRKFSSSNDSSYPSISRLYPFVALKLLLVRLASTASTTTRANINL